jgi:DNA-binding CsgD family transcriptional regulator
VTRRPTPPHGSEARYKGSTKRPPCRCRTCITGWTRAGQKRLLGTLAGRPAIVPAEPVTAHINALYAAHMTPQQIADISGVNVSTIRGHAAGKFPTIRRTRADKILAVQPGQKASDGWMSPLGAIRRCHALYTIGHGAKAIAAAHPDLQLRTVEYLVRGSRQHITVSLHNAISDAYRTLSHTPGTSTQAKQRAARERWHGPLAWDDIDNPNCQPEAWGRSKAKPASRRHVAADPHRVAELTAAGRTTQQIADELGCHIRTVTRARGRALTQPNLGVAS